MSSTLQSAKHKLFCLFVGVMQGIMGNVSLYSTYASKLCIRLFEEETCVFYMHFRLIY